MVCAQVFGYDVAISYGASQGQLELNFYKPLIALDTLETLDSIRLLSDAMRSFARHCVLGIAVDHQRIEALVQSSLMLVTALVPHLGYDPATAIAKHAQENGTTLRHAALALVKVTGVEARLMTGLPPLWGLKVNRRRLGTLKTCDTLGTGMQRPASIYFKDRL